MERPGGWPGLLLISAYYLKYTKLSETHLLWRRKFYVVWMVDCGRVLHRGGGLTTFRRQGKSESQRTQRKGESTEVGRPRGKPPALKVVRSEEHTSELQSLRH